MQAVPRNASGFQTKLLYNHFKRLLDRYCRPPDLCKQMNLVGFWQCCVLQTFVTICANGAKILRCVIAAFRFVENMSHRQSHGSIAPLTDQDRPPRLRTFGKCSRFFPKPKRVFLLRFREQMPELVYLFSANIDWVLSLLGLCETEFDSLLRFAIHELFAPIRLHRRSLVECLWIRELCRCCLRNNRELTVLSRVFEPYFLESNLSCFL